MYGKTGRSVQDVAKFTMAANKAGIVIAKNALVIYCRSVPIGRTLMEYVYYFNMCVSQNGHLRKKTGILAQIQWLWI